MFSEENYIKSGFNQSKFELLENHLKCTYIFGFVGDVFVVIVLQIVFVNLN